MSERIQWLDDLGAELARVAHEQERARSLLTRFRGAPSTGRRVLATTASALVLLAGGAYAVPTTRAAIDDIAGSFAGWVAGDEQQAPGTALRADDDAPDWVREEGGRVIAENDGIRLYASRTTTNEGTVLRFTLPDGSAQWATVDQWRERFAEHALFILGAALTGLGKRIDDQGRFPLLGVTARSVTRVELRYADGPPLVADDIHGGFMLLADAARPRRELVAYDAAGRELERTDVSRLGP